MRVVMATDDLLARGRAEAAARAAGAELESVSLSRWVEELRRATPDLLIVDLDAGGRDLIERLDVARVEELIPERVIGYFSHVDEGLGRAAQDAGIDAFPRGRFWREAEALFRGNPQS